MSGVRSFRDLLAYQSARVMVRLVRAYSSAFPDDERFTLTNQLRRSAYSVALNIAEGYGIGTTLATLRHLRIARGSLCEVRAAIDLAEDAGFAMPPEELLNELDRTARLLQGLIRSLESQRNPKSP